MIYRVEVSIDARAGIREFVRFIAKERKAPLNAERWLGKVWDAIDSLERFPHRCELAPENDLVPYEIRARRVGDYLLLYTVNDESSTVHIIGFRHGHMLPRAGDLPPQAP